MGPGVWAELMSDEQVADALPELASRGLRLGLHLPAGRVGDAGFAALTRRAADAGIPLRLWPLLPEAEGYWIGESNAEQAAELLAAIVRWRAAPDGVVADGVSIDLEPAYDYAEALRAAQKLNPARWLGLLRSHIDPAAFEHARGELGRAVDATRRAGLAVHAVTYPMVLDQRRGSTLVEDAFDIPVSGIDWDEVSFMVYQTGFAQQTGHWFGPALVHSYAREAVARFGERAGIDLGVIGNHGIGLDPGNRYPDPSALEADLAASLSAGIPLARTRLYGLAGLLGEGGLERWLADGQPEPSAPDSDRAVDGLRNTVRALSLALGTATPPPGAVALKSR
jgi:hypothetical protein